MNALDQFFEMRNTAVLLQCLGEKIKIKKKEKEVNGLFISIDNKLDNLLYQENSIMLTKKEESLDEDFEFFKVENIFFSVKKANSKLLSLM